MDSDFLTNLSAGSQQRQVLSVSTLNRRVRQLLETQFPLLWVEGEISNFSCPSSGHWYFTLKDEQAQVRCAMFKGSNRRVGFQPEHGSQVLIRCRIGLYEARGDFQLIAEHMEEAGFGALQRQFEILKTRLSADGLFDDSHKQPLPWLPSRIGVITSPTGAAIKDILHVLERRFPAIPVSVFPCAVQGKGASDEIAAAIQQANLDQSASRCDVLIVGRGGGSLEDLWAFNEESVARAIYQSKIPIISAVGHETDTTIADFVADTRAPTPSAAAELATPDARELAENVETYQQLLHQTVSRKLRDQQQRLDHLSQRLRHPGERIAQQNRQLQHLRVRLNQAFSLHLQYQQNRLNQLSGRLDQHHPGAAVLRLQQQSKTLQQRLHRAVKQLLQQKEARWQIAARQLDTISPLRTLERGYAIVSDSNQQIVRTVASVSCGDKITTRIADGFIESQVKAINPE